MKNHFLYELHYGIFEMHFNHFKMQKQLKKQIDSNKDLHQLESVRVCILCFDGTSKYYR